MSGSITVDGRVDTSRTGIYLLRYTIPSCQKKCVNGEELILYYIESRWVGVTEIMPTSNTADVPLSLTNDSLYMGAQASDVTIERDGNIVSYASTFTDPGVYSISEKASDASASASTLNMSEASGSDASALSTAETFSSGASADSTVTAVIDRTGPVLSTSWGKSGQAITVTVKASDMAGVAQLKYKAGSCSLDDCKNNGTEFTGSFTVPSYGSYTVYARDKLGNESVKAIMVSFSWADFAYLSGVNLSAGTLSRAFTPKTYSYKISLGENEPSVTLTPVKEWDGATMTINGKAVSNYNVSLANGKSAKVTVKVKYGKTTKTYTFSVSRARSSNNNLSGLTATAGSFNTAFSPEVTNYTLALDENTKTTTIRAAVQDPSAKASPSSSKVTLKNGQSKTIKFTVKAQSGTKKTYTVTVTRAKSTNTALKYIKTDSSKYPLSPAYSDGVNSYTVTLPANKSKVTISAKTADSLTSVMVDGKKGSKKFTLTNGQSIVVRVVITAQSGGQKEYTVTINRL
jgi:hypothetical protein